MRLAQFIIVCCIIIFPACSDNGTQPVEEFIYTDYLPLDSGSTWNYNYYQIAKDGSRIRVAYGSDSTVVQDSAVYLGRNAVNMTEYVNNQGEFKVNSFAYSTDSNKIAIYGINLKINDSVSIQVNDWLTIYDRYKSPWELKAIKLNDTLFKSDKYSGFIRIYGNFIANTKVEISGELHKTLITKLIIDYDVVQKVDTSDFKIQHREEYEYRFAKDIGPVVEIFTDYLDSTLLGGYEKILVK